VTVLLVALGAAVGAPLRYLAGHLLDRGAEGGLPWGTVLVNVVGSFVLGLVSALALGEQAVALLGVGFCGGLTTYSAFAVQTHDLGARRGLATALLTVPPALLACVVGYAVGR